MKSKKPYSFSMLALCVAVVFFAGNALEFSFDGSEKYHLKAQTAMEVPQDSIISDSEFQRIVSKHAEDTECTNMIQLSGEKRLSEFRNFLEMHFSNESSTSSLLPDAMLAYTQVVNEIDNDLNSFINARFDSTGNVAARSVEFFTCIQRAEEYKNNALRLVSMRSQSTAAIKKASAFSEKYKQINAKLHELNLAALKMSVNIATFEQKLPCYISKCVSK